MKKCANVPPKNEKMVKRRTACLEAHLVRRRRDEKKRLEPGNSSPPTNPSSFFFFVTFIPLPPFLSDSPPSSRVLLCFVFCMTPVVPRWRRRHTTCWMQLFFSCINNFLSPSKGTLKKQKHNLWSQFEKRLKYVLFYISTMRCFTLRYTL